MTGIDQSAKPSRLARASTWMGYIAVALLSLLLILVSANARHASVQRRDAERWYEHTLDVLLVTSRLRTGVYAEMRGERGYLLTHNVRFLDPYASGRRDVTADARELAALTRDNPVQRANLVTLRGQIAEYEQVMAGTIDLERGGDHRRAVAVVRSGIGKHHIDQVLSTIDRMDREEKKKLAQRRDRLDRVMRRGDFYQYGLTVLGFLLLLTTLGAAWNARGARRRAAVATRELERLAGTDMLTGHCEPAHVHARTRCQYRDPRSEAACPGDRRYRSLQTHQRYLWPSRGR